LFTSACVDGVASIDGSIESNSVSDVIIAPDIASFLSVSPSALPPSPGYLETSEYLIGKVAVGVILLESNGTIDPSTENWTPQREAQVINEIISGLTWLKNQNPQANVSFVYDVHYAVPTSYEPINRPSTDMGLWVREAMKNLGYLSPIHWFSLLRDYVNALRASYGTDWAFSIFVVDALNDPDGLFADMKYGWSTLGGPYFVMPYHSSGMGNVAAHETCHMFYASDEYDSYTTPSGYLGVPDLTHSGCLMDGNVWWLCDSSKQQLGWRDIDKDGIQDIVDTYPNSTLTPYSPNPTNKSALDFTGSIKEIPYPNKNPYGTHQNITINTISRVEFRVDNGSWQTAGANDTLFDEADENFYFTTPPLSTGYHSIEVRGVNSVGNIETDYARATVLYDGTPPTTSHDYDDGWHSQDFVITLGGTDNESGISETYYRVNNGSIQNISLNGQPLVTSEGTNSTLEYWSVDNVGNEELPHKMLTQIRLDKTIPVGSVVINNGDLYTNSTSVTLNLTANDEGSGVYRVRFSDDGVWDNEQWEELSSSKSWNLTSEEGSKIVYFQVEDYAGLSGTYEGTILLDTTEPSIATPSRVPDSAVQPDQSVVISVNVTDSGSGVKSVWLTYFVNSSASGFEFSMLFNQMSGLYESTIGGQGRSSLVKYEIAAFDNAGNSRTEDNAGEYYTYLVNPLFDLEVDGKIDMKDIGIVARAYGSRPGSLNWNPFADINGDGKIDMRDIGAVARQYGEHYP
jgi:hypothetical protein